MSWIIDAKRTWAEWLAIQVLKIGPLPRHLAVIMDGNRRFARLLEKDTIEGHAEGFKKLTELLSWCRDLEINEVTAYAFSIENFKRSKQEIDGLMSLMEEKFTLLLEETDKLQEYGICVRIIGDLSLLSEKLQNLACKVVTTTKNNNKWFLNVAIAYTSREEIKSTINELTLAVKNGDLFAFDVDEYTIDECLYTSESITPPDLLIRTSGEVRLSDFLLWQTSFTHLFFTKVLWPEVSLWHVLAAIFHFQRYHHKLLQLKRDSIAKGSELCKEKWLLNTNETYSAKEERISNFLSKLHKERVQKYCVKV